MATGNAFRAAAAVADVEGLWLSSGERVTWPEGTPGHVGDIVRAAQQLQLGTQVTRYRPAAGQVWVTDVLAQSMGINTEAIRAAAHSDRDARARELTAAAPAVSQALAAGYSIGGREGNSLGRWTRVWQGTATAIFVVLMAAMTDDEKDTALMAGNPTPDTLARRIGLVARHLKHPFAISGSTTGLDLMQALRWKDRAELFSAREPIEPALRNIEVDISWSRKPTAEEL